MLNLPVLRWGKSYDSLEKDQVVHFITGEPIAAVSQANGALLQRDMRNAKNARKALLEFKPDELIERIKKNHFVLTHMDQMLDALTRGLPLAILSRGYGIENRGVVVSYQCQAAALG